jgi:hypothetical protein
MQGRRQQFAPAYEISAAHNPASPFPTPVSPSYWLKNQQLSDPEMAWSPAFGATGQERDRHFSNQIAQNFSNKIFRYFGMLIPATKVVLQMHFGCLSPIQ